eukprot:CAMPEP_0179125858 /NCGR_PEP_ID=MMETSP0796-20121207/59550_1 /TAXON_ID=73915 /ORGANISM="Pyrodinium bahamense, Strain pbaha01" /LENGTH=278 /DNA_ID=CAMNT_0020824589 /DNA_START=56 /DNA_END=892 /DNA_ORIENTATION=+
MAPVKFDDLPKAATEVLNDDYQTAGYQMKAKQKTSWDSATATTTVDLWGKDPVQTPAKLSWKFPKPLGIAGLCVDKLEMDKAGKFKLEASADKALHSVADLKLEVKSDLESMSKAAAGFTFTGLKDTQVKFETKPLAAQEFTLEVTRAFPSATLGLKCGLANMTKPDVGARFQSGPLTCALLAREKLSVFSAFACLKARDDLKLACCYEHGGKKSGSFGLGLAYSVAKGTLLKAKVAQDRSVSVGLKQEVSKGFTVLTGLKYETLSGKNTFGVQLSIE